MLFSCSRFIFPRGVQNFHCHCLMSRQDGLNDVAALFERDPFDLCCCLPAKKTGTKENYSFPLSSPPCSSQHFTFFPLFVRCRVYILYIFWLDVRLVLFPLLSSWLPFVLYIHIYIGVSFLFFLASFFFFVVFLLFIGRRVHRKVGF